MLISIIYSSSLLKRTDHAGFDGLDAIVCGKLCRSLPYMQRSFGVGIERFSCVVSSYFRGQRDDSDERMAGGADRPATLPADLVRYVRRDAALCGIAASQILPPYMRRSPKVAKVLPILYLRGLATGDFRPALEGLLGADAAGLSPTTIARLTAGWEQEYQEFRRRELNGREYVYVWVDGVHFNIRLEDDRLCTLVMIAAKANGEKELLAVEDGYRESAESWKTVLRELKRRGMVAPVVAVGDGALGFWAAAREVWPETREQACWCHKLVNVLDKLPRRLQPRAKRALHEMMYAESRAECEAAQVRFADEYQAKYPKAVESLAANWERLTAFFDFPAEHWKHLRTTNVIESAFATVRLRDRATRGAGSRTKGLLMAFKLLDMAQRRWRRLDGAQLLPLVRGGEKFTDGVRAEPKRSAADLTDDQPR
jgi:putative transposase